MSQNLGSEVQYDDNPEPKEKDATEIAKKDVLSVIKSGVGAQNSYLRVASRFRKENSKSK
jgi:hypothetical protein